MGGRRGRGAHLTGSMETAWRVVERRRMGVWLGGPALLWHQCEEWVWPGGFLPWLNRTVMGGGDEFPITRRTGFGINVGLGWGVCLASSLAGRRAPPLVTFNLGLMAGNAAFHLGQAAKQRRYNPGLATATGLFSPFVTLAALRLGRDPDVGARITVAGIAGGLLASVALFARTRRRSNTGATRACSQRDTPRESSDDAQPER